MKDTLFVLTLLVARASLGAQHEAEILSHCIHVMTL